MPLATLQLHRSATLSHSDCQPLLFSKHCVLCPTRQRFHDCQAVPDSLLSSDGQARSSSIQLLTISRNSSLAVPLYCK
jgi:hypothetical protein